MLKNIILRIAQKVACTNGIFLTLYTEIHISVYNFENEGVNSELFDVIWIFGCQGTGGGVSQQLRQSRRRCYR